MIARLSLLVFVPWLFGAAVAPASAAPAVSPRATEGLDVYPAPPERSDAGSVLASHASVFGGTESKGRTESAKRSGDGSARSDAPFASVRSDTHEANSKRNADLTSLRVSGGRTSYSPTAEERYALRSDRDRRCCAVELAGGGGLVSSLDGRSDSGFTGLGRVLGFGRITDDVLVGGGLQLDARGTWTALLGVRRLITVDRLESRLELQLVSDVAPDFALGARLAAGLSREFAPGWQIGASVGFAAFAFQVHAVADLSATVTASFPQ